MSDLIADIPPATRPVAEQVSHDLVELAAECAHDPLRFVLAAFPWGERGTELENVEGPETWQREVLKAIGAGVETADRRMQLAVAAAHGVGKSALSAWLILWTLATCSDARSVVTANTAAQLSTKTWPELARWHRLCLWRGWFELSATALVSSDPNHARTWRADAIPWSAERPEAFAGLHNAGKRIMVLFDEASAIPDVIWTTTAGAMTDRDTDLLWCVFGNPTRTSGAFHACFHGQRHRWTTRQVDGRSVGITDKRQLQAWIDDYGEDSDFVRVRVRGVFPRAESAQFIAGDLIERARRVDADGGRVFDPVILGCDIARQGDDQTVIAIRKGRDARSYPWVKIRSGDLMQVAAKVVDLANTYRADGVFVDGGGLGAGVVDRLRQLRVSGVIEVQFGGKSDRLDLTENPIRTANKRAEMWSTMRTWLDGGAIPDDPELLVDLAGPTFGHNARDELILERKEDMRRRGLASPDCADALALTFAYPVSPSSLAGGPWAARKVLGAGDHDYDPWS